MDRNHRHNLPQVALGFMWLGLVRAPWLMDSLIPRRDGQRPDRPRDRIFRDY